MNVGAGPGTRTQSVLAGTTSAAIVFWTAWGFSVLSRDISTYGHNELGFELLTLKSMGGHFTNWVIPTQPVQIQM